MWDIVPPCSGTVRNHRGVYAANPDVQKAVAFVVHSLADLAGWVNSARVSHELVNLLSWNGTPIRAVGGIVSKMCSEENPILLRRGYSPNMEYRLTDVGRELVQAFDGVQLPETKNVLTTAQKEEVQRILVLVQGQIINYAEGDSNVTEPMRRYLITSLQRWRSDD